MGINADGSAQAIGYDAESRITSESNPLDAFTYSYSDATLRVTGVTSIHGPALAMTYYGPQGDELLEQMTATAANGEYTASTLAQDMTAYRYSGGISLPVSNFLTDAATVEQISSPVSASIALNLPAGATAQELNTIVIPAGTTIFTGGVAGGADTALQIYVEDTSALILLVP